MRVHPELFLQTLHPKRPTSAETWYACMPRILVLTALISLPGCAAMEPEVERHQVSQRSEISESHPDTGSILPAAQHHSYPGFSLEDRMVLGGDLAEFPLSSTPDLGPLYSFRAQGLPLIDALALFARSNRLNIIAGPEITGTVTVDFHQLPLERAMSALLEAHGYYWEQHQGLIQVKQFKRKTFSLDYIRLIRGGSGQNRAQLNSGSSAPGIGGSQDTGQITVNQEDEIKFWEELEKQLHALMSKDGRLVLNRLSGTIQITDWYQRVDEIDHFLQQVHQALYRQVEIEVKIYEVVLNDSYSLGIDWSRINFLGSSGNIGLANIIAPPAFPPFGGVAFKAATTTISFADGSFEGVLKALQEQGELRVVSQPRIVTLNNQPALIKVATDQPFFTQTVLQGTLGAPTIVTEQARSVTVGLVLSVTPQISGDGWVMLDVTPIISRLREIAPSPEGTSNAPVLDIKQSSGVVRLKDGEMVIIGGLIQEETSETERSVPVLGNIPFLGRLFKGTYTARTKSELVIFLSPKIVRSAL